MTHASASQSVSGFSKAPLVVGLALALGGSFAVAAHASAAGAPMIDAAVPPMVRDALRFGDPQAVLERRWRANDATRPAPTRPAGAVVVANCDDSGAGSLRDAVENAVTGDVIDLSSLTCSAITLSTGLVSTVDNLTLTGPGAGALAIDGNDAVRVIEQQGYDMLTIEGLTIRNGSYTYSGPGIYGGLAPGACVLARGSVTLTDSALEHCSASGWSVFGAAVNSGGALFMTGSSITGTVATADATEISATVYGGAVYAKAAYLANSTIADATITATSTSAFSGFLGGGVFGFYGVVMDTSRVTGITAHVAGAKIAYAKGGGVASPNTVILTASTVADNTVYGTPGVGLSGAYTYTSAIGGGGVYVMTIPRSSIVESTITSSTISNNRALCDGPCGDYTVGGGGAVGSWSPKVFTISNTTLSGNTSDLRGGGLYLRNLGAVALLNTTITNNTAPEGSGIADAAAQAGYPFSIESSIIAGNHVPDGATSQEIVTVLDIAGSHDLIASANVALPGDTLGGDPVLGALADNGGPTLTHAVLAGSPAIDAGSNIANLDTDQRGGAYVRVSGAAADIGAFEAQGAADIVFGNGFD
ncbi:MAG: choice-of-anchor Q domain-containing protein [Rhodanobacteraceae bacterium]